MRVRFGEITFREIPSGEDRSSPWQWYAVERMRFQRRIRIMEDILKSVIIEKLEKSKHPSVGLSMQNEHEQHECLSCLHDCSEKQIQSIGERE